MAIPNTLTPKLTLQFDDRFTEPSRKALRAFKKSAETVFREVADTAEESFARIRASAAALAQTRETGSSFVNIALESIQTAAAALVAIDLPFEQLPGRFESARAALGGFMARLARLGPQLLILGGLVGEAALLVATFNTAWAAGTALAEFEVNGKPVKQYFAEAFDFWLSGRLVEKLNGARREMVSFLKDLAGDVAQWFSKMLRIIAEGVRALADRNISPLRKARETLGSLLPEFLAIPLPVPDADSRALAQATLQRERVNFPSGRENAPRGVERESRSRPEAKGSTGGVRFGDVNINLNGFTGDADELAAKIVPAIQRQMDRGFS